MKYLFTLLFLAASLSLSAQKEADVLKEANTLIASKQYESAFRKLEEFDKDNTRPAVVVLKANIMMDYFVTSMMHQMFALKDLAPGEDIMDYRGKEGHFSMFTFVPNEALEALIAKYPDNCALYNTLGHFYHEVYTKYGENWLKTPDELLNLMEANCAKAVVGKCAGFDAYETLGFVALNREKYSEAIPFYLEAIKLDKEYATSYYNVAYAYLYKDDRANAIKYGTEAYNRYTDAAYKADAARMVGMAYSELSDGVNATLWYEKSNVADPGNYYTLRPLLDAYVLNKDARAAATRNEFFNLAPGNPTIYADLEKIYHNDKDSLIAFYNSKFGSFTNDDKVTGSLHFYLGSLYIDNDNPTAHSHFLKAKAHLTKSVEAGNSVFDVLEEVLEYTKG
ncbi:hypothetical protein AM493_00730 [Flavobacterium akiainvivens]|uniref:Uncharacterized protein n=1 Tax=Flavobacterium akiainvivens TaxID=1202724 RepID=A0A0M8M740_9FLAO|nr:hypothetical protein [Flavobacterium akiainvivens]KOS04733.1 hypothetical protein AM493_00730 [Flavobacterium akiainvivens]SFQ66914.1 hypothetical protein SAMN05444144_11376 [Flavobacterium akiainvivens]